jgi:Flp pilus assembly secretin CpaC
MYQSFDLAAGAEQKGKPATRPVARESARSESTALTIVKSHHRRLTMKEDIARMAVGDSEIVSAELVTNRELLLLGVDSGRTTLLIWFKSGQLREYLLIVERDLSVLHAALHHIHPSIGARLAPDRDAVLLTGLVPDASYSLSAEAVAKDYLKAGQSGGKKGKARAFVKGSAKAGGEGLGATSTPSDTEGEQDAPSAPETARIDAEIEPTVAVINLIRVEQLPLTPEEKIKEAIQSIGGKDVTVRRVLHGNSRDDKQDVFVLEGMAPNQVAVTRILHVAARVVTGEAATEDDVKVVADESGGLTSRRAAQQGAGMLQQMGAGGGAGGGVGQLGQVLQGGGASIGQIRQLQNLIGKNLARAKIVSAAKGRLLSFITVKDLPQVRINVRLYELNRSKLTSYNSALMAAAGSFHQGTLNPAPNAVPFQGSEAARVGPDLNSFQNVLSFLNGTLSNTWQVKAGQFALQAAFSLLNRLNIARTLASPSMTVLSGELATFTVGGEIPIPTLFSPVIGGGNAALPPGVFSSVTLVPFGITLGIRPLVGDDDSLTLDIVPSVTSPDPALTLALKETTGTQQLTTAFRARSFVTHAKVADGEGLVMAGLLTRDRSDDQFYTPGLGDIKGLGWLFRNFNRRDEQQELVVVLLPAIVREPSSEVGMWEFPAAHELPLVRRTAVSIERQPATDETVRH